jgi:hypothetical protein
MDALLTPAVLALAGIILATIWGLRSLMEPMLDGYWAQRLMPLAPLVLGVLAAFTPWVAGTTIWAKLQTGAVAGMAAALSYKLGKTTVGGFGLPPKPEKQE